MKTVVVEMHFLVDSDQDPLELEDAMVNAARVATGIWPIESNHYVENDSL